MNSRCLVAEHQAYHVSELSHVPVKPRSHRQLARLILSASTGSHSSDLGTQGAPAAGYIVPESNAIILGGRRHLV